MINALILIPEITKGMKSLGPKSLLQIKKNLSVVDYQIQSIKDIDKNIKIIVCTGFESERVVSELTKNYKNIHFIYNSLYKITNQAQSIKICLEEYKKIDRWLIVSNGILLKNKCITKDMLSDESKIFILNKDKENFSLGCSKESDIEYIFYGLPELWSECVYLNGDATLLLRRLLVNSKVDQLYLFEIINEIMNREIFFTKQYIDKKLIMKISTMKDITKAKSFI